MHASCVTAAKVWEECGPSGATGVAIEGGGAWRPGLPPAMLYGGVMLLDRKRGVMQEGALLGAVGAAAAALPGQLRAVVNSLADVHQARESVWGGEGVGM